MKNLTLGERIKKIRKDKKINQSDFANKIGLESPMAISAYENNQTEPAISKLIKICEIGDISIDELLTGNPPKTLPNASASEPQAPEFQVEKIKISEDIYLATKVLESGTGYATALHLNIRSFAEAVDEKARMATLENKQLDFEIKMSKEIQSLKGNFEALQSENRTLRTENNRLKSTYEDPGGSDGDSAADTEKKAM